MESLPIELLRTVALYLEDDDLDNFIKLLPQMNM